MLSILSEANDGQRLHVVASIRARVWWDVSQTVARLTALKGGESVGEAFYPLVNLFDGSSAPSESTGTFLSEGETRSFTISVEAPDVSDYQLDVLWGREAATYLQRVQPRMGTDALVVRRVSLVRTSTQCNESGCHDTLSIEGELFNGGQGSVSEVELGVSFAWVPEGAKLDLSTHVPENEERIVLTGLTIEPGRGQQLSIAVDREIPKRPDGRFEPVVRVVSKEASPDGRTRSDSTDRDNS